MKIHTRSTFYGFGSLSVKFNTTNVCEAVHLCIGGTSPGCPLAAPCRPPRPPCGSQQSERGIWRWPSSLIKHRSKRNSCVENEGWNLKPQGCSRPSCAGLPPATAAEQGGALEASSINTGHSWAELSSADLVLGFWGTLGAVFRNGHGRPAFTLANLDLKEEPRTELHH